MRADDCAGSGLRGRCAGFLDRTAGRLPDDERTTLLRPQDGQHHGCYAQANA
jgi:hypothetical protein